MRCNMTFGHLMPLVLASASHASNAISSGIITFLRLRQLKWGATLLFWSCDVHGVISGTIAFLTSVRIEMKYIMTVFGQWYHWHWWWHHMIPTVLPLWLLHSLGQDDWNEVWYDVLVMWHHWCWHWHCDANSLINGTIALLGSRRYKWGATWLFDLWPNNVDPTLLHMQVKKEVQHLFSCLNQICQQQIWPSNAIDMPHMLISSWTHETTVNIYILIMNLMQSIVWPQVQV